MPLADPRPGRQAASLTDLGATLADALGWPNSDRLPGQSFWPAAPGDAEPAAPAAMCGLTARPHDRQFHYAPVAGGSMFAVLHNGLYLIRQGDGTEQVFDFHRDPMEQHDLVNDAAAQAAIAELRELLDGLIGR
jgi:arylsulfatase A-like enzyme